MSGELTTAAAPPGETLPPNWAKWLMAAYIRYLGGSQNEAAMAAGVCERTVWTWENEKAETWKLATDQAKELWPSDMEAAARARVLKAVRDEGDTHTARWYLERADKSLQDPDQPRDAGPLVVLAPIHFGFLKEAPEPTGREIIVPAREEEKAE